MISGIDYEIIMEGIHQILDDINLMDYFNTNNDFSEIWETVRRKNTIIDNFMSEDEFVDYVREKYSEQLKIHEHHRTPYTYCLKNR